MSKIFEVIKDLVSKKEIKSLKKGNLQIAARMARVFHLNPV